MTSVEEPLFSIEGLRVAAGDADHRTEILKGVDLEVRAGEGRLEVEIAATPMVLKRRGKGVIAVPGESLPPLTAEKVRETMERVRR